MTTRSIAALQLAAQRVSGHLHPMPPDLHEQCKWRIEDELRVLGLVAGRKAAVTPKGYKEISKLSRKGVEA